MFELLVNTIYPQVLHGGTARINELTEALVRRWPDSTVHDLETTLRRHKGPRRVALLSAWRAALAHVRLSENPLVLMHYPNLPSVYPFSIKKILAGFIWFPLFCAALGRWGKKIVISVEDLPLLQYRDLDYSLGVPKRLLAFWERRVFKSVDEYWFSSRTMADIQTTHLHLKPQNVRVVKNGCPSVNISSPTSYKRDRIRFVYAGTLARSRGVEGLLSAFRKVPCPLAELHLCGIDGEWIPHEPFDSRVRYYGALPAKAAVRVVKNCDVGIIPYPELGYFQIAYPIKLSLYIASGLSVLSTNLTEPRRVIEEERIGLIVDQSNLGRQIAWLAEHREEVENWKMKARMAAPRFTWEGILKEALADIAATKVRSTRRCS